MNIMPTFSIPFGFMLLVLASCSLGDNRTIIEQYDEGVRPAWCDAPPANDAEWTYSVGWARGCLTREVGVDEAFLDAVEDLARSVSVSVSQSISSMSRDSGGPRSRDAFRQGRSDFQTESQTIAESILVGASISKEHALKIEVDPDRFLGIRTGTDQENLRWDVAVLVSFPSGELARMRDRVRGTVSDINSVSNAMSQIASGSAEELEVGISVLETAYLENPTDEHVAFALGRAYLKAGKEDSARTVFSAILFSEGGEYQALARAELESIDSESVSQDGESPAAPLNGFAFCIQVEDKSIPSGLVSEINSRLTVRGATISQCNRIIVLRSSGVEDLSPPQDPSGTLNLVKGRIEVSFFLSFPEGSKQITLQREGYGTTSTALRERLFRAAAEGIVDEAQAIVR